MSRIQARFAAVKAEGRGALIPFLEAYDPDEATSMAIGDKAENKGENLGGKLKEGTGKATGNERVEAEGQADQASANVKQAGDDVADAAKKAF